MSEYVLKDDEDYNDTACLVCGDEDCFICGECGTQKCQCWCEEDRNL